MEKIFGQYVSLVVTDSSGGEIFETDELRVDFDIRHIDGFGRGTMTIYNLSQETITSLANGDNYATITTRLHDGPLNIIADEYYISNVLEEKKVPNSVTSLYCFDKLRKHFLENQVDIVVDQPTLRKTLSQLCTAGGFLGNLNYKSFPEGKLDQKSGRRRANYEGTLQQCIKSLQETHRFSLFTEGFEMVIMYEPDLDEVELTSLPSQPPDVILDTDNMRSNPKIGPAILMITSNLDARIKPSAVLDISQLITLGTTIGQTNLELAENLLNIASGFSKYQTLNVQHKGSNYSREWKTVATASSPSIGMSMPLLSWQRGS